MLRWNQIYVLAILFILNSSAQGQTETIKRLKKQVEDATKQEDKLAAIFVLCEQGYTLHPDTLMHYAERANEIALQQNNVDYEAKAMYYKSFALTNKGLIDSSLSIANRSLSLISGKIKDPVLEANLYNQKGRCYMRKNEYKEAIDMGYKVIDAAEKGEDTLLQIKGKTLIGWAFLEMGQKSEALSWHLKALHTTNNEMLLEKYGILFANLALNYNDLEKKDSAFFCINKAINYSRKSENLFALSNSLAIQAQLFVTSGQNKLAEAPLKEVVAIRKLIGDPFYIVSDMSQLALYYAHNNEPEKGIALCNEGLAIAKKYNIETKLFLLYSTLAENYKALGDNKTYAEILEKIIVLKDSVYQRNSAEALAEMRTKYDLQKNENIIIQQKLDIVSKNFQLFGSLLLVAFAIIVSIIIFKNYRRKQKFILERMREEEKRSSLEAVVKAEENERKRIAADLHDNMGAYASAISANVDDLLMFNKSDNTILNSIKSNATEIMLTLRDTIWVLNKEAILLTGISDRFKSYVQKIIASYPSISIDVKENIVVNRSLSPQSALQLLRIMQEAFHNAIKHSKCTRITVEIECMEKLMVRITDNGIGFSMQGENGAGHGLYNMNLRAKSNGWQLLIRNLRPDGTSVQLDV